MDIGSNNSYPANSLSNFSGNRFTVDGIECYSMEGFLQSLKFKSIEMQVEVCKMIGKKAKFKGKKKNWRVDQTLYWKGIPVKRNSDEYQELLDLAYQNMYDESSSFRSALRASGNATLTHSMGRTKQNETVLTVSEFCGRLLKLRRGENLICNLKNKQLSLFHE